MNKTRLGNGRGIIPNTFGRPFCFGNLDLSSFYYFTFISGKKEFEKNILFKIDSIPSPSFKILEMAIG